MEFIDNKNENIKYPQPAIVAVVEHPTENKVLVLKSKLYENTYKLIKGHVLWGESLMESVKKHVKQETGYFVNILKLLAIQESIFSEEYQDQKHYIFFVYYCKAPSLELIPDTIPLSEYLWIDINEVIDLTMSKSNKDIIRIYLNMKKHTQI